MVSFWWLTWSCTVSASIVWRTRSADDTVGGGRCASVEGGAGVGVSMSRVGGVARDGGEGDAAGGGFPVGSWLGVRPAMAREIFQVTTSCEVGASSGECRLAAGETIYKYNEMV